MRNRIEIEVWMRRNGFSVTQIQKSLDYKTHTFISNTLSGREHSRKVLQYLKDQGCPTKYLDLPKDMKEEKVNRKKKLNKKERL